MNDCRVIAYGTIVGCVCEVIKERRMDRGGIRGNLRGKLILGGESGGVVRRGVWRGRGSMKRIWRWSRREKGVWRGEEKVRENESNVER